ncbi:MAG: DUF1592 domain-containing protein, partial [Verrucomicrobiales bacterium]|nr:DUF1592 domain-containing protein [Verrucomicrobiales bacterium]
ATDDVVYQFLGKYCLECHDNDIQKGERNLENFALPLKSELALIEAHEIIDQVTLKEMPPKKADQPTDQERLDVIAALREGVAKSRGVLRNTHSRTVMRRLSSREYENTLETLFGRRVDTLGLTADFPKENTSQHIDTIGESLITSGFLLDQYFLSANRLVDLRLGRPEMEPQTWHFTKNFVQYEELSGPHRAAFKFRYLCLYEQPDTDTRQGGYGHIEDFLEGVPVSGLYDIKVLAQAMHRDTHYDADIFKIDFSEPFILGVVPGDVTKGHIHYPQAIEPLLGKTVVPDEKPEWLAFRVWLEAGQTPRFIFPNGPYESRASVIAINKKYKDEFKAPKVGVSRTHLLREGKLPHIRISEVKIHGPVKEPGGSTEENAVFGKGGFREKDALNQLCRFAEKAFRRPLTDRDRSRIEAMYKKGLSGKLTPRKAALDTVKMILCSPFFIYLSEVTDESNPTLSDYDLASRLAYTLWGGPPDQALLDAARDGKLTETGELTKQIRRMIKDEKIEGFVNGFLDSWLNLRDLGQMPPPRNAARVYYYQSLPTSMKKEARLFFHHMLKENRPVSDFLHSDYTFADKKLAHLYQLPGKEKLRLADGFQRMSIKGNRQRGGVLGMAAVLTVSANGVDTSPVTRGVWVSENILGITPPPPPDEVPEIESDVRGATTIRDRLEKHSADKLCSECHRKIDPFGFGLETFDPIGRWRVNYPKTGGKSLKIDPSGELPSGETFSNFAEFRKLLVNGRKDLFTRNLVSRLLTYSTGRHMEAADRFEVEEIQKSVAAQNYGLQTLVVESLVSDIFRSR